MSFSGGYGLELQLSGVPVEADVVKDDVILFSESNSRFIVEVQMDNKKEFEGLLRDIPCGCIGRVMENELFTVRARNGALLISEKFMISKKYGRQP